MVCQALQEQVFFFFFFPVEVRSFFYLHKEMIGLFKCVLMYPVLNVICCVVNVSSLHKQARPISACYVEKVDNSVCFIQILPFFTC